MDWLLFLGLRVARGRDDSGTLSGQSESGHEVIRGPRGWAPSTDRRRTVSEDAYLRRVLRLCPAKVAGSFRRFAILLARLKRSERKFERSGIPCAACFGASVELPVDVDLTVARPGGGGWRTRWECALHRVERARVESGDAAGSGYLDAVEASGSTVDDESEHGGESWRVAWIARRKGVETREESVGKERVHAGVHEVQVVGEGDACFAQRLLGRPWPERFGGYGRRGRFGTGWFSCRWGSRARGKRHWPTSMCREGCTQCGFPPVSHGSECCGHGHGVSGTLRSQP
jgi:hypothetical protein